MEEIIDILENLGFMRNDANVYLTLLKLGKSKPVIISKRTGIVRARVYDSLKRLEKKGYVDREAVQRAPLYFAKNPEVVLDKIRDELQNKIQISKEVMDKIKKTIKPTRKKEAWAVKGVTNIRSELENIISNSEKEILCLITPDYTKNADSWLLQLLKSKINKSPKINILLKIQEENVSIVREMIKSGAKVYHWSITEEIPLGIYTSDSKKTILTVIGSWSKFYKHDIGFLIQGPAEQHKGFEFLVNWYFSTCKSGEERCKELEGEKNV